MNSIKKERFDKLLQFLPKSKIQAGEGKKNAKYPFFSSSSQQTKFIDTAIYGNESLIFGSGGSASVHYCNEPFSTSTDCFVVNKIDHEIDIKYIYYYLKSNIDILEAGFKGAGLKHISKKYVSEIHIPVLPYQEQQKIAQLLSRIELVIAKREENLKLLDELVKSTFLDMFGDPVRNEKGWPNIELSQFGDISTGNTPPRNDSDNYIPGVIEWIKTDNITSDHMFISKAEEKLSKKGLKTGRILKPDALLVACIAGSIESIGRAALTNRDVAFNQQINAIQPNKEINSYYLYWLFKMSRKYIQDQATKGMKKILTKGVFEKIHMIKPPKPLQDKFALIVEKVEKAKEMYQASLNELNNLFKSLSQKAFKGELDLSQIELVKEQISIEESKVLDENKIVELIKAGKFEVKNFVNDKQSYDDIRDMVLKLIEEGKIKQKFTADKKIVLEVN